jgi:Flp pilus assembly protein TadG
MLMRFSLDYPKLAADERGAVLVIAAVVLAVLLVVATFAIDAGIWFVHHRHLQTQADAAALAAAQNFQYPCSAGGTMDQAIAKTVGEYGGTSGTFNQQVPVTPATSSTYSSTQHNLISELDQANFVNQSVPSDSGLSGSPCADSVIDVKLTETNLPSFFPFVSPHYVNAQARVSILKETSAVRAEPFAEPLPTPNTMTATLVDESNNDATVAGPFTLTPSADHTAWTTSGAVPVTFNNSGSGSFPVGMRVAMSGGASAVCGAAGVNCYATDPVTPALGVTYTRVWSNSGTPGVPTSAPVAPQASDVTLAGSGGSACPNAPSGTFSNFVSSSSSCTVALSANMVFTSPGGTALSCETASLILKAGGSTVATTCPNGGPNGTWTSAPVTVSPNSGPVNFTLSWQLQAGKKPTGSGVEGGEKSGNCTPSKPCTGSFDGRGASSPEVVQRVYSGAYDSLSEATSHSGPILGASLTDAQTGNEVMTLQRSTMAKNVNITINVLGFQNSQTIPSPPFQLSFGGNQENAALQCGGSAGSPQFEANLIGGCEEGFSTTSAPAATACPSSAEPPACVRENPGGGKLEKDLDKAMNQRINEGRNACVDPNRWAAPNTVTQVVSQSPPDPRLITVIVTDFGALGNGSAEVPIRIFATFYVTGWAGDPCIGQAPGVSNGLAYTTDDNPGAANKGVLLGHFVKYVSSLPKGTGSGLCSQNAFGNCIAVLTR